MTIALPVAAARASVKARRRRQLALLLVVALCLVMTFISMIVGAVSLPASAVARVLLGGGSAHYRFLVENFQLPRVLLCWVVGIALGAGGGVLQGVVRNPLAAPNIIGLTQGAGLAAVVVIVIHPSAPVLVLPLAAFAGGLCASASVYLIAYRHGTTPARLALVGVAVGAVGTSGIYFFLERDSLLAGEALTWLAGDLYGRTMGSVYEILPWLVVLGGAIMVLSYRLDVLGLGDDLAAGLGERVERTRRSLLLCAVALCSAAVAVAGTIGFVGLVAPHIAKRFVGGHQRVALAMSSLVGAMMMLVADTVARGAAVPIEVPTGLVCAAIGAPYFLYLLARTGRAH